MKSKIYSELLILLLVFFAGWAVIAFLRPEPSLPDMLTLDASTEESLGELMYDQYMLQNPTDNDSLQQIVDHISERLILASPESELSFKVHYIESSEVNAFASLGGHIFIHSALIELCESPEELAAVIAHEMGHVSHRHVADRMVRELGSTVLLSVLSGGDPAVLTEIAQYATSTAFSRDHEREADLYGLDLLKEASIHPVRMATLFRRLKTLSADLPDAFQLMSTHPALEERIRKALEYSVEESFEEEVYDLEWHH